MRAAGATQHYHLSLRIQAQRWPLPATVLGHSFAIYALPETDQRSRATYPTALICTKCWCVLKKGGVLQTTAALDVTQRTYPNTELYPPSAFARLP